MERSENGFNRILSLHDLPNIRNFATTSNYTITCVAGCFDILHAGHVRYLEKAKETGDILIVGVVEDTMYQTLKRRESIVKEQDRVYTISRLRCVDHAVLFSMERDLFSLLPDTIVISPTSPSHRINEKRRLAERYGTNIVVIEEQSETHTTDMISRMRTS